MEKIPREIVKIIFQNLTQDDIANVRLVCKEWMEEASPLYLNSVTIALRRGSVDMLDLVAEHQLFRFGMKLLVLDIAEYQENLASYRQQYGNAIIKELMKEVANAIGDQDEKVDLMETVIRWRDFPRLSEEQKVEAVSHYSEVENGKPYRTNITRLY